MGPFFGQNTYITRRTKTFFLSPITINQNDVVRLLIQGSIPMYSYIEWNCEINLRQFRPVRRTSLAVSVVTREEDKPATLKATIVKNCKSQDVVQLLERVSSRALPGPWQAKAVVTTHFLESLYFAKLFVSDDTVRLEDLALKSSDVGSSNRLSRNFFPLPQQRAQCKAIRRPPLWRVVVEVAPLIFP